MTTEEAAYLAGFFDGDGYLTIRAQNRLTAKNPCYVLVLGFTNTHLPVLRWIRELIGGALNAKARKSEKHSPAFELTVHNKERLGQVLFAVLPFVRVKKPQVELGLAFLSLSRSRAKGVADLTIRLGLKEKLGDLNRRGPCLQ